MTPAAVLLAGVIFAGQVGTVAGLVKSAQASALAGAVSAETDEGRTAKSSPLFPLGAVGSVQLAGDANYASPSHGASYLAMRLPRGTIVTITGAGGTWTTRTTDVGPVAATGDIADIALGQFARLCGWTVAEARQRGECPVVIEYGGVVTLPATDTAPDLAYWLGVVR